MADLIFVAVVVAFFGLAVLLVQLCDRIIGPDPAPAGTSDDADGSGEPVIDLDGEELATW